MTEAEKSQDRWRIGWRVLFAISLALNFLVIGAVAGALIVGRQGPGHPGSDLRVSGHLPFAAMLPHEARRALRSELRTRDRRSKRAAEKELTLRIAAQLRDDPFVPETVAALLTERRDARQKRSADVDAALVSTLAGMSPEARSELADRLQRHAERRGSPRR